MIFTRRTLFGASAASAVGLTLASCTKSGAGAGGNNGSVEKKAVGTAENDINAKPSSEVAEGGVLRLAVASLPANWNTGTVDGNDLETALIASALYPNLILTTAAAELKPNPVFLKRAEVVKQDPFTVEFEFQENLKWSDGTPINYKSFANVVEVITGKRGKDYQIISDQGYDKIKSYEQGENDRTARVVFDPVFPDWIGVISVAPDSLCATAEAWNTGWKDEPKVTCGPYKIEHIDTANGSVTLIPDPNYPGEQAKLDKVVFQVIADPDAGINAFKNGQLDSFQSGSNKTFASIKPLIGEKNALRKSAAATWLHLTLNGEEGRPLADKAVREALFYATPRDELFKTLNSQLPYPDDMKPLQNRLIMPNADGYEDRSNGRGAFDLEKAKKTLTDAGYKIENGVASKDGKAVEFNYVYNDNSSVQPVVLQILTENYAKIGVKVNPQKVPVSDLFSKYVTPGNFDMVMFTWTASAYLTSGYSTWTKTGNLNFTRVGTDKIDELYNKVQIEADPAKGRQLLNDVDEQLWELANCLPLWQIYEFFIQDKDLANYGAFGWQSIEWEKVGWVKGSPKAKKA